MGRKAFVRLRKAWEDKYRTPSVSELVVGLDAQHAQLFRAAREALGQMAPERLSWLGIPWRWSLVYGVPRSPRPLAYLVPQPSRPLVIVPLGSEIEADVLDRKLSKPARDAIMHAPVVGEVRWTQWDLSSKAQLEEVLGLARSVHSAEGLAARSA
jgi:hypothetical protein